MTFADYVRGRTIAIVGPAPVPYDQADEIDAHDIVYRTSYGFTWKPEDGDHQDGDMGWPHVPGVFPAGTGTRVDMSFYNGQSTRAMAYGYLDAVLRDLDWAITKHELLNPIAITNQRWIGGYPHMRARPVYGNQVTLMLWDLASFEPADVTVFGADFYMGKVEDWYAADYMAPGWHETGEDPTQFFHSGEFEAQEEQRQVIRAVRDERGWPNGDERFLKALYTSAEEHEALMRAEQARHHERQAKV